MQRQTRYMERTNSMARGKRGLDPKEAEEEGGQPEKKRPALASVIVEALKVDSLQRLCSSLEPILRRVVSEEVERALAKLGPTRLNGRSSPKQIDGPDGRNLQLHFRSRLSLPLFTGGKVEGEQGASIHVVLLDANTGHVVTSGPESSAKLDVVVLEGDFNKEDDDNWSQEEFESQMVKEREGKRPLLTGDLQVTLKEGVGSLGDLIFTDNSSWIRSRKFRLGLKVASGYCESIRIREAKTDAFNVKDHRGELYKKHYPPALNDEVWRLEKIGKDGSFHKKLSKAGICIVEDFLRLVIRDPQRLRKILGSGMSNKMWEILIEHAKTCVLSGKLYVFYPDDTRNAGVVFNNVYELSGLIANGQYYPADSLSDSQKVYVDTLVKKAYDNWMNVIEYDGEELLSFKHDEQSVVSQSESLSNQSGYSSTFNHQGTHPHLPAPAHAVHPDQTLVGPGLTIDGYNNNPASGYFSNAHHGNSNTHIQFDGSFAPQNQLVSASHQTQMMINDNTVGLATGPPQSSASVFQTAGPTIDPSIPCSYSDWSHHGDNSGGNDLLSEEEIRMKSHEILENDDMQHLLHIFSTGNHDSINGTGDEYPYSSWIPSPSPNYNYSQDNSRSSGKGVVGWLKIKAALRWGFFIRKKAAERRRAQAQLVELDD